MVRIGTAGWTIPRQHATAAQGEGSHLQRYARVFACAEINSSFYRSHRLSTWARWAAETPDDFRFSVKFPKAITHDAKLTVTPAALDGFFTETAALEGKLGAVLVQLPPSLAFADCPAPEFFEAMRDRWQGAIALEPRHASWFGADANDLLAEHRISRVASDPPPKGVATALRPGGWPGLAYFRLHGSPRTYYSDYDAEFLARLAQTLKDLPTDAERWVIFDNTAVGHAFANATSLKTIVFG